MSGGTQPAREPQAVPVGQAQVQEQQVDAGPLQEPGGLGERVDGAHGGEAGHPADVERVRVGGHRIVLDDQHAHLAAAHRGSPGPAAGSGAGAGSGTGSGSGADVIGRRTVNSAPPPGPWAATTAPP